MNYSNMSIQEVYEKEAIERIDDILKEIDHHANVIKRCYENYKRDITIHETKIKFCHTRIDILNNLIKQNRQRNMRCVEQY